MQDNQRAQTPDQTNKAGLPRRIWASRGSMFYPKFSLVGCFLQEGIETQNLGKAQALGALPAVAALKGLTAQAPMQSAWTQDQTLVYFDGSFG